MFARAGMPMIGCVFALLWAASTVARMLLRGQTGWISWVSLAGALVVAVLMAGSVVRRSRETPPGP